MTKENNSEIRVAVFATGIRIFLILSINFIFPFLLGHKLIFCLSFTLAHFLANSSMIDE
jgi:hypothetical protein